MAADDAAVVVRLQANLKDYEAALKNAVRATERAATQAEKAISNVGKGGGASNVIQANFAKSSQAIANDARQLQFQLNDIFSGIASGQGVRAVQQQLGQIAQQLSGGGLVQGARTMGAALVGMVNPINLAVVAFGALATAAASYFFESEDGGKKAETTLKAQRDLIAEVANKWGDALPALKAYNDQLERQEEATKKLDALTAAQAQTQGLINTNIAAADQQITKILDLFGQFPQQAERIEDIRKKWEEAKQGFADGTITIDELRELSAQLIGTLEKLPVPLAKEFAATWKDTIVPMLTQALFNLRGITTELQKTKAAAQSMPALDPLGTFAPGASTQAPDIPGLYAQSDLDLLRERAVNAVVRARVEQMDKEFVAALAKTLRALPNARILSGLRTFDEQAAIYNSGVRPAAKPGHSRHETGRAADITGVSAAELAAAAANAGMRTLADIGDPMHVQLLGDAVAETVAETRKLTTATVEARDAWAGMREPVAQAKQEVSSVNLAAQQMNQQMAGILGGGLSGFVNDLIAGEDAGDAFTNMLQRMTAQIADMIIQMVIIKPLMNSLFGGMGGGGGLLGIPIAHGGGSVSHLAGGGQRKASPLAFANAPRFASGGMVGLRPGEVPIIAHRGEIIVPNARRLASSSGGGRVDNSVHQQNKISIDMSGSGYVAANSESARQMGEDIQKMIELKLVKESRPGGLLRRVPS